MEKNLTESLKNTRVFSSLNEETLVQILPKFTTVELKQHDILFYQGEPSDSVYLLLHGRLLATLTTAFGDIKKIGYIEPGEMVGELGAIVNEPRSLTIKVLKEATLLKIFAKDFIEVCHTYPTVLFAVINPIIMRSNRLLQLISAEKMNRNVVIVPANKSISIDTFVNSIKFYAEKLINLIMITDDDVKKTENINETIQAKIKNKKTNTKIVYLLSTHDTPLAKVAFKRANLIYIVGKSDVAAHIDHSIFDKIENHQLQLYADPSFILLHEANQAVPQNTREWLLQTRFGLHHHVRENNAKDYHRLLRFIRGKAVGLVLSGGGTRGFAHVGVIKAIRELKIPIDIIGGSSAGAVVAACYAMQTSYQSTYQTFSTLVKNSKGSISWRSLTWPLISLFNSKKFTEAQKQAFSEIEIENLWIPYFCVSSNLTKNSEEIHTRGLVWERTRASTSIPGLIPPMVINGELHVDGGLLNNLPVDIMRDYVGKKGKIIAVELTSFMHYRKKYSFPPILTFKDILFNKLGIKKLNFKLPRFVDIFLRSLLLGSAAKTRQNSLSANIFIDLNLSQFHLLNVNSKQAEHMINIGYKEGMAILRKQKSKD